MHNMRSMQSNKKVIVLIIILMILIAGAIVTAGRYYGSGKVAGVSEESHQVKLLNEYKSNLKEVFRNYLLLDDDSRLLEDQFSKDTSYIKERVLDMKVPHELIAQHLNIVVSLNGIENGIIAGDLGAIVSYIYELRLIIDNI